jgi:hypothetical protein
MDNSKISAAPNVIPIYRLTAKERDLYFKETIGTAFLRHIEDNSDHRQDPARYFLYVSQMFNQFLQDHANDSGPRAHQWDIVLTDLNALFIQCAEDLMLSTEVIDTKYNQASQ